MTSVFSISTSGLYAAAKKLEVSAGNTANVNSTKTVKDGVVTNEPYHAQIAQSISNAQGGVTVKVKDAAQPTKTIFDPTAENADANGNSLAPNVNLDHELVNQRIASYDYKANLKAIRVQLNLDKSLLDIKS